MNLSAFANSKNAIYTLFQTFSNPAAFYYEYMVTLAGWRIVPTMWGRKHHCQHITSRPRLLHQPDESIEYFFILELERHLN